MITCLGLAPALDITYGVATVGVGRIHRPEWVLELAGGKAINVARALVTLGGDAHVIAPLGGYNGAAVEQLLATDGIPVTVVRTEAITRRCITAMDARTGVATEFYEPAPLLDEAARRRLLEVLAGLDHGWLTVSGSMPAAVAGELAEAAAAAVRRGARVAADIQGAALRELLATTRPAVVKVNRAEASELFGPGEPGVLAEHLHAAGSDVAVVTDGAAGAAAVSASGAWTARPGERGRYAVGSGDSFLAGLVLALSRGDDLPAALALATAAAAANTRAPGAARFSPSDVTEALAGAVVEPAGG